MKQTADTLFEVNYNDTSDNKLIIEALAGSGRALESLIKKHQGYIYNIAHKMVLSPFDAEDITQEVIIKIITKLSQFKNKSNFRTWLYRIVLNHVLYMKKYWLENEITDFSGYGSQLDTIADEHLTEQEAFEMKELIEESKLACINGMLLCLERDQRIIYILGEIFGVDHNLGSELLEISRDNFRQKLSCARKDLYQFMNHKCGLINSKNPCRCAKKTKGFISAGWVNPDKMKFNTSYVRKIVEIAPCKSEDLDNLLDMKYADIFKNQPFQEKEHVDKIVRSILFDPDIKKIFNLD